MLHASTGPWKTKRRRGRGRGCEDRGKVRAKHVESPLGATHPASRQHLGCYTTQLDWIMTQGQGMMMLWGLEESTASELGHSSQRLEVLGGGPTCAVAPLCQLRAACPRYTDDTQTKIICLAQNAERCGPRNRTRERGGARAAAPFRLGNCSFASVCAEMVHTVPPPPPSPPAQSVANKVDGCGF